jgi:archaellum component FlaC
MHEEDIKNLVGWLQAIYKETQLTRGATTEMRRNIDMIPEIRTMSEHGSHDSNDAERKIEETKNHLENQIRKLEDMLNEVRHELKDIHSKLDHLK